MCNLLIAEPCTGIIAGHWPFPDQFSNLAAHFLVCLNQTKLEDVVCLTLTNFIVVNVLVLLGDKQARREVYIMVCGIPSSPFL